MTGTPKNHPFKGNDGMLSKASRQNPYRIPIKENDGMLFQNPTHKPLIALGWPAETPLREMSGRSDSDPPPEITLGWGHG